MEKATIKMVLGSYRANHQDAEDPILADALRELERDPELKAWFEEEQRFDRGMMAELQQVPTPADLKDLLLLNAQAAGREPAGAVKALFQRQAKTWLAIAAGLAIAFVLGRLSLPPGALSPQSNGGGGGEFLATQAIAYTGKMPALQFVCFDASLVAGWVNEQSAALHMGKLITKALPKLQMIGSSTARWEGKPVIMIALQNGHQMAMLYLVRATDFPGATSEIGEVMEKDGWVSQTGRDGDNLYVLTTKGTREDLHFPNPL
jgi:hypothetical protein